MSILYPIGESGQFLTLEQNVLDHFVKWRQLDLKMPEAGGQLFGAVEGQRVKVKLATGPRRSDRRGRFFFIADRLAERLEISALHKSGLHYLGDWHTHPQYVPIPSGTDLSSMADLFARSKHDLNAFLMVIVGTAEFPEGLHVSLHEANAWSALNVERET
ncbi:Mov34/MPN/PAD-1 family protein [Paracoccus sulfuroxidans]|uniref:Mov34/MPN/PAD-1 family protein n=1 Tax=Paracoccus sulfuroxidans TaxID=384678 RepID=UPI0011A067C5|nr:Mov34/MPN/PAD-1 family protein [Paracoccus sulfuroxidans]